MQYRGTKVVMRDGTDPNQQQVRQDMYHAWKDLQTLKNTQPGGGHKSATRGNLWRVSSTNGQDKIELLGYPVEEKVVKKKERKIKTNISFLPAIGMLSSGESLEYYYNYYNSLDEATLAICNNENWGGCKALVETIIPYDPGMKPADLIGQGLYGLVNHGFSNFKVDCNYELYAAKVTTDEWPDNTDPEEEIEAMFEGTPTNGYWDDPCPEISDWYTNPEESPIECDGGGGMFGVARRVTRVSNTYTDCGDGSEYVDWTTVTNLYHYTFHGYQYKTWSYYFLEHMNVTVEHTGKRLSGFCFNHETSCDHDTITDSDGSSTVGSQYTYFAENNTDWKYSAIIDPSPDRPGGDIKSGSFVGYSYNSTKKELLTPCDCQRTDYHNFYDPYPFNYDTGGAYIPNSNTLSILDDKYIILYRTERYKANYNNTHNDCDKLVNSGPTTYGEDCYVDVNGELLLLDSCTKELQYFVITDSHIVVALGAVYYMYAYLLYDDEYGVKYTAYGYFKDDISHHYPSQKYKPAGLTKNGYVTPHHDVAGSSKLDNPLYGIGKCSGYSLRTIEEFI